MTETLLITGATGFLGSHLTRKFVKEGLKVLILKRSFSDTWRINDISDKLLSYDIDRIRLEEVFKNNKIDVVLHTSTKYDRNNDEAEEVIETNVIYPLKLLKLSSVYNTTAFINTDTFINKNGRTVYKPLLNYSLSKRHFFEWARTFENRINIFNLRLEHIYGEMDGDDKFIPSVIRELIKKSKEIKLTPGEQKRDFIYVSDVAEIYFKVVKVIGKFEKGLHEYRVGSGKTTSIKEIVSLLKVLTRNNDTVLNFGALPYREEEIVESKGELEKIKVDFDWEPKFNLLEGLRRTVDWYQNNIE